MAITLNGTTGAVTGATSLGGLNIPTAGFGKVLQVVYATTTTGVGSASTTFIDTTLSASITPSSTSSRVIVLVAQNGCYKSSGHVNNCMNLKLVRNSTDLIQFAVNLGYTGTAMTLYPGSSSVVFVDTPSTTSSTTYKTQLCSSFGTNQVQVQADSQPSTMILMEVGP